MGIRNVRSETLEFERPHANTVSYTRDDTTWTVFVDRGVWRQMGEPEKVRVTVYPVADGPDPEPESEGVDAKGVSWGEFKAWLRGE